MDATGQGLIIDVLGKELDGEGKVTEGQVLANVMHKVGKCAIGEGPAGGDATSVHPVATVVTAVPTGVRSSMALVPTPTLFLSQLLN